MTLVCCWLDKSYGQNKITALADARAADLGADGKWTPRTELTTKLYKVPMACYSISSLNPAVGGWDSPYYTTEIGIGFAGYCFEAMSIIALFKRFVGTLVAYPDSDSNVEPEIDDQAPTPEPKKLVDILMAVIDGWFSSSRSDQHVEFLLFGFSPQNGHPWCAQVERIKGGTARLVLVENTLQEYSVFSIGDAGHGDKFKQEVEDILGRIRKQSDGINAGGDINERLDNDLEKARLHLASRKTVEQAVINEINNEFRETVGGVLQKMEIYAVEVNRAVAGFTRDSKDFNIDMLPAAADRLGYIPILQNMGRVMPVMDVRSLAEARVPGDANEDFGSMPEGGLT
ncbi:hypothetical protein [Rhodanobacter hydrolyticus]|uniref:Uncharacterized protein n=1 Tax=Rhodanobacter hydrolyticus TaxID=2250595 RepID=A0ABW8J3L3_9GAMM